MTRDEKAPQSLTPPSAMRGSIRVKFAAAFCLLFALGLCLVAAASFFGLPYSDYGGRVRWMKNEAFRGLELIADLKRSRLVNWLTERGADARALANLRQVGRHAARIIAALAEEPSDLPAPERVKAARAKEPLSAQDLQDILDSLLRSSPVYTRARLADAASGVVFAATRANDLGVSLTGRRFFTAPLENRDGYLGGIEPSEEDDRAAFHLSHAVLNQEGGLTAVLVLDIDPEDIIRPMLQIGDGLGAHGEALLVDQDGLILTSLKFPLPDGTRPGPLYYRIPDRLGLFAAAGQEGTAEGPDYRGVPVLAAYRHVRLASDQGWGLVVKRDENELMLPAKRELHFTLGIGLCGFVLLALLAAAISRTLTRPIRALDAAARNIAAGDPTARARVFSGDEIGRLALVFNDMLDRLQNRRAELEDAVASRTRQLDQANQSLQGKVAALEQAQKELRLAEENYRILFEKAPVGIYQSRSQGVLTRANPALARMFGFEAQEDFAAWLRETPAHGAADPEAFTANLRWINEHIEARNLRIEAKRPDGSRFWTSQNIRAVFDEAGQPCGHEGFVVDIDEHIRAERTVQDSLREKEILLKEIHHRVKNNLQIISSLLALQSAYLKDPRDKELFSESVNRVLSMAMVHEDIYLSRDFANVGLKDYIAKLSSRLAKTLAAGASVTLSTDLADIGLSINQAVPCGLILNELITNCFKHAFPHASRGLIAILLREENGLIRLTVADNGPGLSPDLDWQNAATLGLTLVTSLAAQLHGTLELAGPPGASFTIVFPKA